jgi:branched-chain amino acid transport system permease protein
VLIVVLGGIGTLWGSALGAVLVVQLEDFLATAGFDGIGIVTGAVFIAVVLLFRRGMWGTATLWLSGWRAGRERRRVGPAPPPDEQPASDLDLARKGT